jgi:hypothetical protein
VIAKRWNCGPLEVELAPTDLVLEEIELINIEAEAGIPSG